MNGHRVLLELAPSYPFGPLDPTDSDRIEAHLKAGCRECEALIRKASAVADELVYAVAPVEPSAPLSPRRLDRVEENGEPPVVAPPREARIPRWQVYALATSLVLALLLGIRGFHLSRLLETEHAAQVKVEAKLGALVSARDQAVALLKSEAARRKRLDRELTDLQTLMNSLTAKQTRSLGLAGAGPLPAASARAYLDPQGRRLVLFVYDLPPARIGKSYQLWVTAGDRTLSAGVFGVGRDGRTRYETRLESSLAGDVTIAVTIESEGGAPEPSGPTVLVSAEMEPK